MIDKFIVKSVSRSCACEHQDIAFLSLDRSLIESCYEPDRSCLQYGICVQYFSNFPTAMVSFVITMVTASEPEKTITIH